MAARRWTEAQRQRQSQLIQKWQPWRSSTGAKTAYGKARSSQNALKHGFRSREAIDLQKEVSSNTRHLKQMLKDLSRATEALDLARLKEILGSPIGVEDYD